MRVLSTVSVLSLVAACLLVSQTTFADIQTVTYTVKQPFGGSQSPDDARVAAIAKAKREALEKAGTYLESLTVVRDHVVEKDEILALAAGVLKAEIVSQKNYATENAFGIVVIAKVDVDISILDKRVKKMLQDHSLLEKYRESQEREGKLLAKIKDLEEQNRKLQTLSTKRQEQKQEELKKEFREVTQALTAIEWNKKALALWKNGEFTDPRKALEYLDQAISVNPNDADAYINRGFAHANLGNLGRMCYDFEQACALGRCGPLRLVEKQGDCR